MTAADQTPATDSPKMIRETLCAAQSAVLGLRSKDPRTPDHVARLQRLIDEVDAQRPLGPDGKHGNRHTPTCGCEDTPATDSERDDNRGPDRLAWARKTAAIFRGRAPYLRSNREDAMVALDGEVTRLTKALTEPAAPTEPWDVHWAALYDQIAPLAAEIQKDPEYESPSPSLARIFAQSQIGHGLSGDERYTFEKYVDARRQNEWFARKHPLGSQRTEGDRG